MIHEAGTDLIEDLQDKLLSIIKYASLDYHIKVANNPVSYDIQKANEYAITLIRLWDECDKHSTDELERVIVNVEGRLLGIKDDIAKIIKEMEYEANNEPGESKIETLEKEASELNALKTQITDYLKAREETGEMQDDMPPWEELTYEELWPQTSVDTRRSQDES